MAIPESLKAQYEALPAAPGVYIYKDADGRDLYVGKAKDLRKRVRQYFDEGRDLDRKTLDLVARIAAIDCIECGSEVEALLLENRLIKDLQPPFNFHDKSDISFPLVEITWNEPYPRVLVTHGQAHRLSTYYGPFTSGTWLRVALQALQRAFPYRTCSLKIVEGDPKNRFVRPCLEYYIGRCKAPCAGRQSSEEYRGTLRNLVQFLQGKGAEVKKELEREMRAASKERHYEQAASFRDTLKALQSLGRRGTMDPALQPAPLHIDPQDGVARLQGLLDLASAPRTIEGIDIAHLHGQETVGALVSFVDGLPSRERYRRFRIRTAPGDDDCASIREVVTRRYLRLKEEGHPLPDLVLIDGGLGQLHAAEGALQAAGLTVPCLASLAKQEEIVFTLTHPEGLRLPRRSPALRLLQYVRDEAHRFAQHYHHILRRKRTMEEE